MTSSIAAIHVAKKQLGLDDDTYRAKLAKITGKSSVKDMSEAERQKVLTVFRNDGFRPADAKPAGGKMSGPFARKLQALWIAGYNLGVVSDRRDAALIAFVKRQTGLDAVRFLHHADDARAAIDGLKGWLRREAGVSFGNLNGQDWLAADGAKIAWAQWKILNPGVDLINRKGFDTEVFRLIDHPNYWLSALTSRQWQVVMNALGERVRTAKKGGA
ncbi:MAG: regulatory protein GemA [Arenimonas sp.]|nr:regulatory protein GemA [Rhizobium sp.]MBW8444463.1 regulatory protein GemA [Arenimonas sp.]